jgi:hypothetical protein
MENRLPSPGVDGSPVDGGVIKSLDIDFAFLTGLVSMSGSGVGSAAIARRLLGEAGGVGGAEDRAEEASEQGLMASRSQRLGEGGRSDEVHVQECEGEREGLGVGS